MLLSRVPAWAGESDRVALDAIRASIVRAAALLFPSSVDSVRAGSFTDGEMPPAIDIAAPPKGPWSYAQVGHRLATRPYASPAPPHGLEPPPSRPSVRTTVVPEAGGWADARDGAPALQATTTAAS